MRSTRLMLIVACCLSFSIQTNFLDTFKGIGSSIENFPLFKGSFYTGMGRSFGAPPTGYVYSFSVYNDSSLPVYVGIQEVVSIMGGTFPKAGGWSSPTVAPFSHYDVLDKEYYFEIIIRSSNGNISNHMPYLQHADTLYQQEVIQLQEPHSTKHNYFRTYMGKDLVNGVWVYGLKGEYLGFADPSAKGPHASKGLQLSSKLTSLTIENSTDTDYYVGYTSTPKATTMTARMCQMFSIVQAHSFGLYSAPAHTSLRPGTIGVFDLKTESLLQTYNLEAQGFDGKSYTLEIYSGAAADAPEMSMQGLMPGNYDVPVGRVRDITPMKCVFWYQAAAGKAGLFDLPGKVWIVSGPVGGAAEQIMVPCLPGNSVEWTLNRPVLDKTLWLYFLYVDSVDDVKSEQYLKNFIAGKIGAETIAEYKKQSKDQMIRAQKYVTDAQAIKKGQTQQSGASQVELRQAIDGALKMHQGRIEDTSLAITGYLLGADVFLPQGAGPGTMHYQLAPALANNQNLPTSVVQNLYAFTLDSSAPKGMPTPTSVDGKIGSANKVAAQKVMPAAIPPAQSRLKKAANWVKSKVAKAPAAPAVAAPAATT